jgi:hypothetical protein
VPDRWRRNNNTGPAIAATANGWTGTWSAPVKAAWRGTFTAVGPVTDNQHSGNTDFDFTGLATGVLPAGTYLSFGGPHAPRACSPWRWRGAAPRVSACSDLWAARGGAGASPQRAPRDARPAHRQLSPPLFCAGDVDGGSGTTEVYT